MKNAQIAIDDPRRRFLAGLFGSGLATGLGTMAHLSALAQTTPATDDYRALVCVFLYGGNDGNNLLVPYEPAEYAVYQRGRDRLALARDALLPIAPANTPGRGFGLHPAMAGLQGLFQQGKVAALANSGPLLVPTSKAQWSARSVPLPENLFSHSDQQAQWQSAISDAAPRSGWGGRLLERLVDESTANRGYSALSLSGGNLWEGGDRSLQPYKVSSSGRFGFDFYRPGGSDPLSAAVTATLAERRGHLFEQAWLDVMTRSIDNQRILTQALNGASTMATVFPDTGLGRQLRMAARLIASRAQLGMRRQTFFTSIGGFDTHGDDQLATQNRLLGEISSAVTAFDAAMVELGADRKVTLFTASDFSRTFPSNGAGSDHAWGGHHLVVGGSVRGGQLVGDFPDLTLRGPNDAGNGLWIPTIAVDEVAATLGRWFGAGGAQLAEVLPRLGYFRSDLGFMNAAA
jgi:uncharacterized protein (DUF1501 family)